MCSTVRSPTRCDASPVGDGLPQYESIGNEEHAALCSIKRFRRQNWNQNCRNGVSLGASMMASLGRGLLPLIGCPYFLNQNDVPFDTGTCCVAPSLWNWSDVILAAKPVARRRPRRASPGGTVPRRAPPPGLEKSMSC